MKILHTADWHLGQTFLQKSRIEEHKLFIDWLLHTMIVSEIDAVIVAGDIFDVVNPSMEAMDLYHHFLLKSFKNNIQVVIVGGNHDSASRLNTTKSLFQLLNVHIVGGETGNLGQIIPLKNKKGINEVVMVAVPYLRDGDIRKIAEAENVNDAHQKFSISVKLHYDSLLEQAKLQYPNLPVIATAHLYVNGSSLSDSTENMHAIGTLGQISSGAFHSNFSYVALGHIHKPQIIKHTDGVLLKYAGSPIPLSFSERDDLKEVTILDFDNDLLTTEIVNIPVFRLLKRVKGSSEKVITDIEKLLANDYLLGVWVEIVLTEKLNFIDFMASIEAMINDKNIEILTRTLELKTISNANIREIYQIGMDNNPLDDVAEIFKIRCEKAGLDEENQRLILPLFEEILNQVNSVK